MTHTTKDKDMADPTPLKIEYNEVYVPKGQELEVFAYDPSCVNVLDVTQIGDELRYRYTVVWSGEARKQAPVDGNGH